jgi:serine/threonine protein kinase
MKSRLRTEYNTDNIDNEFHLYVTKSIKNEIEIMRICMKDNINSIKFYEFYDIEKEYAIVMELCDDNLQNILNRRNTGFNKDEIYDILTQLNNTFKIMSENIIIHRDLKLENILVKYVDKEKSKFIVKLTDYGVSRKMISLSKKCKTYSGTLITMSPEILAGEEYDNESDLWSLGVIIYQLFFKKYPYDGATEVAIYKKINELGQKILKETGDKNLDDLIRKLLVSNSKERIKWEDYFNHPFFKK